MEYVKFKKDGLYSKEYDETNDVDTWSKALGPIYLYFQSIVEIDNQLTVGDLVRIMIGYESDIDAMFLGCSRGNRLRPYYDEMMLPPSNKRSDLSHVEIGWVADYYKADNHSRDNELYLSLQVSAISRKSEEATYHSLSRASLNDWKHLKIQLNDVMMVNEFIVHNEGSGKSEMHVTTLLEARKEVTLYDLIAGVLTELSMYGYPEQRQERIADINHILDMPSEELLQRKEVELVKAIESEDYEQAAILKREIDNIKKCMHGS